MWLIDYTNLIGIQIYQIIRMGKIKKILTKNKNKENKE